MQKRKEGNIEVACRSGTKLVFPKDTSKDEIEYLIKVANKLDCEDIKHIIVRGASSKKKP